MTLAFTTPAAEVMCIRCGMRYYFGGTCKGCNPDDVFTAVYEMDCGNGKTVANIRRFAVRDGETLEDALKRENLGKEPRFIFKGHPRLQGE